MPLSIALLEPRSIEEAVALLEQQDGQAKIVAGATALTILLRQGLISPQALISLAHVPGLRAIEPADGHLRFGALATHRDVELSPLVRGAIPVLADTFGKVANVRVRNAATVGGVMAEADYASDPPAVFLALDAEVEVARLGATRSIPAASFFLGFYQTALQEDEIVTAVRVPVPAEGTAAVYEKYVTRSSEDRPCLGVVAVVRLAEDRVTCADLRVAVGAVAETPQRFRAVEALAAGQTLTEDVARAVAEGYAQSIDPLADLRGSAWYRTEMVRVWVRRAILRARDEAQRGGEPQ